MKPEGSLPSSQQPAIGLYPEPDASIPRKTRSNRNKEENKDYCLLSSFCPKIKS
jgi:hypothetical protein